jgi:hypothetical protein
MPPKTVRTGLVSDILIATVSGFPSNSVAPQIYGLFVSFLRKHQLRSTVADHATVVAQKKRSFPILTSTFFISVDFISVAI